MTRKKALIIIAPNDFQDIEFLHTKEELEKGKIKIVIASTKKETAKGMQGTIVKVDLPLKQVDIKNYDAIIFIGGLGASPYYRNKKVHSIINEAYSNEKKICAICVAPLILAKAGILKGKRATVYDLNIKELAQMLKDEGAIYTGKQVEVDGNIITANGPNSARKFGRTIVKELNKQKKN